MNIGHNHSLGARCVKLLLKITLSSIIEVYTSKSYRAERSAYHPAASSWEGPEFCGHGHRNSSTDGLWHSSFSQE